MCSGGDEDPAATTFVALGTTATVLVTDPAVLEVATAAVTTEIDAVDEACSRFRADSELSRVNAGAGRPVAVSGTFFSALAVALRAAEATEGLVDPTIGEAIRLLGYDRDFALVERDGPPAMPAHRVPGWRAIRCDRRRGTVRLPAGVTLDLGATAKAWCADRAAAAAAEAAGAGVLVSLGGDIAVAGPAPDGGWRIRATDDHASPPDAPGQTVAIRTGGLATSSTSVRRWQRGGRPVHHVIDPATGAPAEERWRAVSVAAGSCTDANIASTAAIILGDGAPAWLDRRRLPARLVAPDGAVTTVAGWPADPGGPDARTAVPEGVACTS
jgi:thiamine biosynthesis lipoprotein